MHLVLTRRYDEIKIADILRLAKVGRSTFYEHFRSKDDIHAHSLIGPFSILADAITEAYDPKRHGLIVGHFWENRRVARITFAGQSRAVLVRALAAQFELRLKPLYRNGRTRSALPARLLAIQLAEGQLSLLHAWLTGEVSCRPEVIANALYVTAISSLSALGLR
jgi:AcrR family transcriptional regulator